MKAPLALGLLAASLLFPTLAAHADPLPWTRGPKVDPLLASTLERAGRARALVELADPLAPADTVEPCTLEACRGAPPMAEEARLRDQDRAARKARVLGKLQEPRVIHAYPAFALIALEVDPAQLAALAADPEVARVHADRKLGPALTSSVPFTGVTPWHSAGRLGAGTSVAVLDSAVRLNNGSFGTCPSPGAAGCAVTAWLNFTDDDPNVIAQRSGHGTNVAGIVLGVAPGTKILSLNVFHWDEAEQKVSAWESDVVAALNWIVQNGAQHGVAAANLSLGSERTDSGPCNEIGYYTAVRDVWNSGVVVVIASGNEGQQNSIGRPGCLSLALTVGAQHDTDLSESSGNCLPGARRAGDVACFSNLNGALELLAPGVDIDAGGLSGYSGTSMATPHVSGAVAVQQGWYLSNGGAFKQPWWIVRHLLLDALPRPHSDGRRFQQLNLDWNHKPDWDQAWSLASYTREESAGSIPGTGSSLSRTVTPDLGWTVGGLYLALDLVHPSPQDVEVKLTNPAGQVVTLRLPGGQANFNGVIGRAHLPGALLPLAGGSIDGNWVLRLRDTVSGSRGYLLNAALYFVEQGCRPACGEVGCGDDRCGGACPFCIIDRTCRLGGQPNPANVCQECVPAVSPSTWSNDDANACTDNNKCTRSDRCNAGRCVGSNPVVCEALDACHAAGSCTPSTGNCSQPLRPDGTGCDDQSPCTLVDACVAGACVGGEPMSCAPPDACQEAFCDPFLGGCATAPKPDGHPCDDGNRCTRVDSCQAGACVGSNPMPCEAPDACHQVAGCDPGSGACLFSAVPDGTGCDDRDLCTRSDACSSGVCAGEPLVCAAEDACHLDGACDPATGECVPAPADDGAPCGDGQCAGGICVEEEGCGCSSGAAAAPLPPALAFALALLRRRRRAGLRS